MKRTIKRSKAKNMKSAPKPVVTSFSKLLRSFYEASPKHIVRMGYERGTPPVVAANCDLTPLEGESVSDIFQLRKLAAEHAAFFSKFDDPNAKAIATLLRVLET